MVEALTVPSDDVEPTTMARSPFLRAELATFVVPSCNTVADVTMTTRVERSRVRSVIESPEKAVMIPAVAFSERSADVRLSDLADDAVDALAASEPADVWAPGVPLEADGTPGGPPVPPPPNAETPDPVALVAAA
jgi:hypothetical protein